MDYDSNYIQQNKMFIHFKNFDSQQEVNILFQI